MNYETRLLTWDDRVEAAKVVASRTHVFTNSPVPPNPTGMMSIPQKYDGVYSEMVGVWADGVLDGIMQIRYFPGLVYHRANSDVTEPCTHLTSIYTLKRDGREKYEDGCDISLTAMLNAAVARSEARGCFTHWAISPVSFRMWRDNPHYCVYTDYDYQIIETVKAGEPASNEFIKTYIMNKVHTEDLYIRINSKKAELRA